MKIYEILSFNRELLRKLLIAGIRPEDCRYIDLYEEYRQHREGGGKITYIVATLAEKYNVSERQVYLIIDRFEKDCKTTAV